LTDVVGRLASHECEKEASALSWQLPIVYLMDTVNRTRRNITPL
jgi:hypothetical protein